MKRTDTGLILPGDPGPRSGLTISVPRGYEDENEQILVCRVQVGDGEICGKTFRTGEERAWQKHVGDCARQNMEHIVAASPRKRMPVFDEATWDPEYAAHMRKVGEQMLREGRLVTRPNEV